MRISAIEVITLDEQYACEFQQNDDGVVVIVVKSIEDDGQAAVVLPFEANEIGEAIELLLTNGMQDSSKNRSSLSMIRDGEDICPACYESLMSNNDFGWVDNFQDEPRHKYMVDAVNEFADQWEPTDERGDPYTTYHSSMWMCSCCGRPLEGGTSYVMNFNRRRRGA